MDAHGRTWFIGMTESRDLPLLHAHQSSFGGGDRDGVIAALSATGGSLIYASYHGGADRDLLEGVSLADGLLYATGMSFGDVPMRGPQLLHAAPANVMVLSVQP